MEIFKNGNINIDNSILYLKIFLGFFLLIARAIHVTDGSQLVDGSPIGISVEKELAECFYGK